MSSNITLNIVEPGSAPVVPNTGLFTSGVGGPEATIITISAVILLALVALIVFTIIRRKKVNKTVNTNDTNVLQSNIKLNKSFLGIIKKKKSTSIALTSLALLVSLGTVAGLIIGTGKGNTNAAEVDTDTLTVTTSDTEFTIELADEPVFAVLPVQVTVEEATQAGYTLTAYADNTDLVSTTDESKTIPMIAVDNEELVALEDNTYGLSLTEPEDKDSEVYTSLSTDVDNPTPIAEKEEATEPEDKTTIYYAFYITPDTPYGTYTGSDINYNAEANRADLAKVTFDGNGLLFDNGKTTNVMKYEKVVTDKTTLYSHTPNVNDEGEQTQGEMYPIGLNKTFVYEFADATEVKMHLVKMEADGSCGPNNDQYFSFWQGNYPNYTAVANWKSGEKVSGSNGKYIFADGSQYAGMDATVAGNTLTFAYTTSDHRGSYCGNSGYGYYAIITATDADGNPAYATSNVLYSGTYKTPATTAYDNYEFLGWSLDANATSASFADAAEVEANMALAAGEKVTLYAVWSPIVDVAYDGNNATVGSMQSTSYNGDTPTTVTLAHEDVIAGNNINLYAPNYKKTGYGFVGWSADQNAWADFTDAAEGNDPVIYGPNQTVTITKDMTLDAENGNVTLYAVWAPAETNITMQTFDPTNQNYGSVMALKDERDNEVYAVAKLADGNWWMIENLRLDDSATLTKDNGEIKGNTNNPNLPLTNSTSGPVTSNKLSASSNSWCTDYGSAACYDQSIINTNNTNLGGQGLVASYNENRNNVQWYSYGNYYNWYSATAGNGTYSTGEQSAETVAGDLCPAGWKLPIGNQTEANGSFSHLDVAMGGTGEYQSTSDASNRWRSFPNNFVYSGLWYDSSAYGRGSDGYYWSSTAGSSLDAYYLRFYGDYVGPGTSNDSKYSGGSVRCLAPVGE